MISGQVMEVSAGADLIYDLQLDVVLAVDVALSFVVSRDGGQVAELTRGDGIEVVDPALTVGTLIWRKVDRQEAGIAPGVYTWRLRATIDEITVDEGSGTFYVGV